MRNRVITVPKSKNAEEDLNYDRANQEELVEWQINDEEFMKLFTLNVFDKINNECNALIDDFESEEITDLLSLKKINNLLSEVLRQEKVTEVSKLNDMVEIAIKYQTGLYFFF